MTATSRPDVYSSITGTIIAQLEAGVRPWHQPWNARHSAGSISRPLRNNGQPYNGVNIVVLWLTAFEKGYSCPLWLTFNQAKELGGFVRKGEKSTTVVYANSFEKTETDRETGEERTERIPFLKSYSVFNAEQVEGLPGHYYALAEGKKNAAERLQQAEAFFAASGAKTQHGGNRAYYSPAGDYIQLPPTRALRTGKATTAPVPTNRSTGPSTRNGSTVPSTRSDLRMMGTPSRNSSPSLEPLSSVPTSAWPRK